MSDKYVNPLSAAKLVALVKSALSNKADKVNATKSAAGLMSAADKVKLDGIAAGATKVTVDSEMSASSTNPVENRIISAALTPIKANATSVTPITTSNGYNAALGAFEFAVEFDIDFDAILANLNSGKHMRFDITFTLDGSSTGNIRAIFDTGYTRAQGVVGSAKYAFTSLLYSAATVLVIDSAKKATLRVYDRYLPRPNPDGTDSGKTLAISGTTWAIKDAAGITVDTALDASSTNPVQNKAVKAALDDKLSKSGGDVSGYLSLSDSITVGRTKDDTGVHLYKDSVGVAKLTSGSADVDDNVTMARLKVGTPTEDDDAATKQYVDSKAAGSGAVRYDEAQALTEQQKLQARKNAGALASEAPTITSGWMSICPDGSTDSNDAVHVTVTKAGNDNYTAALDGGPENWPVHLSGVATPTDAQTDHAATVDYVKKKIAEVAASGGVDVDNALSTTSENPVQNKVIALALTGKAGTAVATQSANGLMAKSDKAKLDGIADGANKTTVDAALDADSTNAVQNKAVKAALDGKADKSALDAKADVTALDAKADKTALDAKADASALAGKMDKSGGTFTGNVYGQYFVGTWLQTTAASDLGRSPGKIAVLDESGWVYYRTPAELLTDLGADYITAQGTTGVWTWRKWASGIAEMWATFEATSLAVNNAWGSVYYGTWMASTANKNGRKYPFAFADTPVVTATPYSPSTDFWLLTDSQNNLGTPQTYAPAYACVLPGSTTITSPRISYYVVGKYK